MSKLSKARLTGLYRAIGELDRGIAFLMSERIAVCTRETAATTTLHYTRPDGSNLYEIERGIGSELCLIQTARDRFAACIREIES